MSQHRLQRERTSRYTGVSLDGARPSGIAWLAAIHIGDRRIPLGRWASEQDAAHAYDRAALHYLGPGAKLNLPRRAPAPADYETILTEARLEKKKRTTSKYLGVSFHKRARKFMAALRVGERRHYLGLFADEIEAARAYDKAVLAALGRSGRLNFDPATGAFLGGKRISPP